SSSDWRNRPVAPTPTRSRSTTYPKRSTVERSPISRQAPMRRERRNTLQKRKKPAHDRGRACEDELRHVEASGPSSNPAKRGQDQLRRQRNLGDHGSKWSQRIIDCVGDGGRSAC